MRDSAGAHMGGGVPRPSLTCIHVNDLDPLELQRENWNVALFVQPGIKLERNGDTTYHTSLLMPDNGEIELQNVRQNFESRFGGDFGPKRPLTAPACPPEVRASSLDVPLTY